METLSPSTPFPFQNSRVRVSQIKPSQTPKSPLTPLLIFLIFTLTISPTTSISQFPQIPYSKYCNDVIPETPITQIKPPSPPHLQLSAASFSGGDKFLGQNQNPFSDVVFPKSLNLQTFNFNQTESNSILKLEGVLVFRGSRILGFSGNSTHQRPRGFHYRGPKIPVRFKETRFQLYGFWSSGSGQLCMVGSAVRYLPSVNVVLKLNYPNSSNIFTSLVNGTLQCLESECNLDRFEPISILGVSTLNYNYTLIDRENENGGFSSYDYLQNESLGLNSGHKVCSVIRAAGSFEMEYVNDCGTVNCNPLIRGTENLPRFMFFNGIECSDNGRVRYLLGFTNSSLTVFQLPFDLNTSLVAEGAWDGEKKRLSMVACRIFSETYSLSKGWVGDCSIRLSLSLPATFSLRNRSIIFGEMWSTRSSNDSSYFGRIVFRSPGNKNPRFGGTVLKYEYTENENVRKSCAKKMAVKGKAGKYPSGYSSDMRFDMTVRNTKGQMTWGYSSPLFVGDKFFEPLPIFGGQVEPGVQVNHNHSSVLNISYVMNFNKHPDFKLGGGVPFTKSVEISAEGIYDAKTGLLCMLGCRHLASLHEKLLKNNSMDCDILVNVQYPPLNGKSAGDVKGTIESTRSKLDPLYFERLEIFSRSIYTNQAKESLWRMDLEITMVLVSNTLACIFVGMQLLYVKKHPDVLPFISIMMLIVLTLAHMIPLLLNFEAMFLAQRNRQNVFLGGGGWLEVNEVLVRVITMIAFLLQFRLVQLTWSARVGDESQKNLWVSDKKVLYLSLPLYIGGGLIAWFVHLWRRPHQSPLLRLHHLGYQRLSYWGELKSYAGLILDGFLLPQILFNLFCDSRERALSPSYYMGTTVVRLLPHAYDLYRAHSSTWSFNYIYANPRMDYYSTAWDIIISCGGLLFVFLLYLQQRFGSRCFLPRRFRETSVYEKVPVLSIE